MYRLRGFGTLTDDLSQAITRMEGACSAATVCRNNNPGNLRGGPGATGVDSRGIAIFPDYTTGEAALEHQVQLNIGRGLTLQEFFTGKPGVYTGYDKTNPTYAQTVGGWLGIDPNTVLSGNGTTAPAPIRMDAPFPDDTEPSDTPIDMGTGQPTGLSGGAIAALAVAGLALVALVAA